MRQSITKIFIKVIFFSFISSFTLVNAQTFNYKQYTEEDGLPSLTIYEIAQDSSGILWIGTDNGLVSFDGEKFEKRLFPEFQNNEILQVFIHETGDVGFANLANEIGLLEGDEVLKYRFLVESMSSSEFTKFQNKNYFSQLVQVKNSIYFIQGFLSLNNGIAKFHADSLSNINDFTSSDDVEIYCLEVNNNDQHMHRKLCYNRTAQSSLYKSFIENGKYFIQHRTRAIFSITFDFYNKINAREINYFTTHNDHYFYILKNSAYSYDPLTNKTTLINDKYTCQYIYVDREDVLWISTQNNGLVKYDNYRESFDILDFYDTEILSIDKTSSSFLVVTYENTFLYNQNFELVDKFRFNNPKKSIARKFKNYYYLINNYELLTITDFGFSTPVTFTNINIKDFLPYNGKYVVGTVGGLLINYKENTRLDEYRDVIELPGKRITKLWLDEMSDNIFIGTTDGLFTRKQNQSSRPYCSFFKDKHITTIKGYGDGMLLVGIDNYGLFILKNDVIIDTINIERGLFSNKINDVSYDNNYIAMATNRGVSLYDRITGTIKNLTSFHGLPSSIARTVVFHEGNILAGVGSKLLNISIDDFDYENVSSSKLSINKMLCNNENVNWGTTNNFAYDHNKIELYYNHVSLRSSIFNKLFKYRIKEIDDKWEVAKEPIVRLPALQPGKYTVDAKGVNEIGEESNLVSYSFTIRPPWWQTTLARIAALAGIFLIVYLVSRYRKKQFMKKEKVKREYLKQINEIKDQALQLQMNPHFIFNSLNAIQNFIVSSNEKQAVNYLARFARMIRLIFEHSKINKITLEQELEFIELYLNLEKLRFNEKVEIDMMVSEEILENKDVLNIPPLLIQPIVENSFKHGLFHKDGLGKLFLKYDLINSSLIVTVQDNGIGRKASADKKRNDRNPHVSSGISTTKERLDILSFNKKGSINTMQIEDLVDEEGRAMGTKTVITLAMN